MAVGIDLPKHYMKKEWLTMFMFLIPVMIFMWLVSGLFIWGFIPPINYLEALVIAACVCPTDPILANSVVKGRFAEKHVPAHIRNVLSAESGANDGMGFPFLFLAIFLLDDEQHVGQAIGKWIYLTCLYQIILSCIIGIVIGWVARKILQWSESRHLIDKPSFLCFAIALALFLMSMTGFSGSDDLLACFVAGNAFSWDDWFRQETEEAHFQEVIDMMLNLAVFVYIGAIIPWSDFGNAELGLTPWRLVVIAILILLFRRLPIVLLLKPVMPAMKTYREAIFSGWFGPMGVGAVFLSTIAKEEMEHIYQGKEAPISIEVISPVVLFIVLSSTLVHGTTIPLFKLGKRIRTRTLSVTSTGSNQVLRLPKLQFGRTLSLRRNDTDGRSRHSRDMDLSMSQTQRNTLINTIQHERHKEMDARTGLEQSIRFLEPVKPRAGNQSNSNLEKNEASVSSMKSWRNKFAKEKDEQDITDEHLTSNGNGGGGGGGGGLRNLFRRQNKDSGDNSAQSTNALKNAFTPPDTTPTTPAKTTLTTETGTGTGTGMGKGHHSKSIHPRIEIWEEDSHVIIEDKRDSIPQVVINKTDTEWKQKAGEAVRTVEQAIKKDENSS
ncbi:Sodium/hydrogen exchanger family-domain-containing protein [Phycomyces blakesleeanus]